MRTAENNKTIWLQVRMTPEMKQRIYNWSAMKGRPMSKLVRETIIKEIEKEGKAL